MLRPALVASLLILAGSCSDPGRVSVVVHVPGEVERAARVDVWVVDECPAADLVAEPPPTFRAHSAVSIGHADPLGALPAGTYGLQAIAWRTGCIAYAAACGPVEVDGGDTALELHLSEIEEHGCGVRQRCVAEACVSTEPDAGAGGDASAGGDAAPPADAGEDAGSGAGYAAAVLEDGPVGYWRLGESETPTAFDASGNGHDGIYSGGVTLGVPGAVGDADTALRLDDAAEALTLGDEFDFPGRAPFSVEVWLKPQESDYSGVIWGKVTYSDFDGYLGLFLVLHIEGGTITLYREPEGLLNGPRPQADVFHHIVVTYDGVDIIMFLDGLTVGTTRGDTDLADNVAPFQLGYAESWSQLEADFDGLAVYDHALTSDRVEAHWDAAH